MPEQEIPNNLELETSEADQTFAILQDTIDSFMATASVEAVYGEPIKEGDTLIIPTSEIVAAMAFGVGSGHGEGYGNSDEDEKAAEGKEEEKKKDESKKENISGGSGSGRGGGGGGRVFSRPVAVIIASPEGVRVEPVVDATKILLALFTTLAFMFGMLARLRSPRKSLINWQNGSDCC